MLSLSNQNQFFTQAMEDKSFPCIIEEMDHLWFHQLILFSEPIKKTVPILQSLSSNSSPTSILSFTSLLNEETSIDESTSPQKQVLLKSASMPLQNDSTGNKEEMKERMARMNVLGNRTRSNSSSPSTQHYHRKFRKPTTTRRKLDKSMSCKTLGELELDEVKGFMDLGFIFKKENLSPRMMSVVPGLQRLGLHQKLIDATEIVQDNDNESEEEKRDIKRPYLSEAWVIKRPDSPLLSLKIPKPCSAATMKKHLQVWAKTVASEVHEE
ncbi:PREDICTED: uncharacterized protein LOC109348393 isoform X2 [Lupinus angustifolius]|uniref:uncharacterized protein LOC109348393 isoform X2 n=1 Tax=Lupinus angustifolius TaxID=3871 RepID=UPI00092F64FD|nr:PREDICTED: uncharacterized protein LOC109348393 isoform X2 [Lupinus angustifolius]